MSGQNIRSIVQFVLSIACTGLLLIIGCSPLDVPEAPREYDIAGEVIALIVPDTVQSGQSFTIKISFPDVCGGTLKQIIQYSDSSKVVLTPVLHIVEQSACPAVYTVRTETTQVQLNSIKDFEIIANGRLGYLSKNVTVVPSILPQSGYTFRFQFQNLSRNPKPNQSALFSLLDRVPVQTFTIMSDSTGIWSTTIVDSAGSFRYSVNELTFKANKGVREDGVFLFP